MKVLIIDNHTKHLKELVSIFDKTDVVQKENLTADFDLSPYGLLVISGGSGVPTVLDNPDQYLTELKLVRASNLPILGICLGSEILAQAFGGKLRRLEAPHRGIVKLEVQKDSLKRVLASDSIKVHESHKIGIEVSPPDFEVCAKSDHGIEIIKHRSRLIIGIQFHPEISKSDQLLRWIFDSLNLGTV